MNLHFFFYIFYINETCIFVFAFILDLINGRSFILYKEKAEIVKKKYRVEKNLIKDVAIKKIINDIQTVPEYWNWY